MYNSPQRTSERRPDEHSRLMLREIRCEIQSRLDRVMCLLTSTLFNRSSILSSCFYQMLDNLRPRSPQNPATPSSPMLDPCSALRSSTQKQIRAT